MAALPPRLAPSLSPAPAPAPLPAPLPRQRRAPLGAPPGPAPCPLLSPGGLSAWKGGDPAGAGHGRNGAWQCCSRHFPHAARAAYAALALPAAQRLQRFCFPPLSPQQRGRSRPAACVDGEGSSLIAPTRRSEKLGELRCGRGRSASSSAVQRKRCEASAAPRHAQNPSVPYDSLACCRVFMDLVGDVCFIVLQSSRYLPCPMKSALEMGGGSGS